MKTVICLITISAALLSDFDFNRIARVNATKEEARKAIEKNDYAKAIENYRFLIDSLQVDDEAVRLNLASAYFLKHDTAAAQMTYSQLAEAKTPEIRSQASLQSGNIFFSKRQLEQALACYKQALKAQPSNEEARYNYELTKKLIDEQQKQQQQNKDQNKQDQQNKDQNKQDQQNKDQNKQDQQNKDQNKQDQQNKDQNKQDQQNKDKQNKEQQKEDQSKQGQKDQKQQEKERQEQAGKQQEEKERQKQAARQLSEEKLQKMNLSKEKAKMILEAMRNSEAQYLQQKKRKATRPRKKNTPQW